MSSLTCPQRGEKKKEGGQKCLLFDVPMVEGGIRKDKRNRKENARKESVSMKIKQ